MKLLDQARGLVRDALQNFKQALRAANRQRLYRRRMKRGVDYAKWIAANDTPTAQDGVAWTQWLASNPQAPLVSLILNVDTHTDVGLLERSMESLKAQRYPRWQLIVTLPVSGAAPQHALIQKLANDEPRIRPLSLDMTAPMSHRADEALRQTQGSWIALLQAGDMLRDHALLMMAQAAAAHPDALLIYPDEDQIDTRGHRNHHHFKPDWNADFQRSANYIGHVCWVQRAHLVGRGGFSSAHEAAHEFDTLLRCTEGLSPKHVVHVPHVLWHQPTSRHKQLGDAAKTALQAHLDRTSPGSSASLTSEGFLRVQYAIPTPAPLVSIVICTRNQYKLLETCIRSITSIINYPRYEIIIVDNGSDEARTLDYLAQLPIKDERVRVIRDDSPFNYAALNNMAVEHAQGDLVALLNNDIEVIHADWLTEMVGHALRPEVGCVGAKLLYPDDTVQHVGVLVGPGKDAPDAIAAHYLRGIPAKAPGYANRAIVAQQLTAVTAACLVIRKATFLSVGGLDAEHLAVTYNDVDFCLRVGELGLHHVLTPHAVLYHHESVSRGRDASSKNKARFLPELAYMQHRWASQLQCDPNYNPNLSYQKPDFLLAGRAEIS